MKKSPPPGGTLRFGWQGIICSSVFIFLQDVHCSAEPPLSANPAPVFIPRLNCPVYVMEYHIWYRSPFGRGAQPGYVHWGDTVHIDFPLSSDQNIRDMGSVGYPLLGLYDSENPEIIRWQLRCAHNAGIDGLFVHLFPDQVTGTYLGGSKTFATILHIAGEEHVQVAAHDEVMFRTGWKAQRPDVMALRISEFIKRFGSDPAYLKIGGHPVYAFQYWTQFIAPGDMAACLDRAEHLAGVPIHFFVLGGADALYQRHSPSSFVTLGNSMFIKTDEGSSVPGAADWLRLRAALLKFTFLRSLFTNQQFGLWAYPGFNNQPQEREQNNPHVRALSRQEGNVLAETLTAYSGENPDFIVLSSWNDWMENSAFEPGYRFDSFEATADRDPYRYCRMLAAVKGRTFEPPPLPPKEAIDPLRWQSLYGVDATPPVLKLYDFSHGKDRAQAVWVDSGNTVTRSVLAESGDAWFDFLTDTGRGIRAEIAPERVIAKAGLLLTEKSPVTLHLDGLSGQGKLPEWYLALQFQEQGPAVVKVNYTSEPAMFDYREFDGVNFSYSASMKTGSLGLVRTEVSVLHAASFDDAKRPTITVSLSSLTGIETSHEASVFLRRIDLFHTLANAIEGKCISPDPEPRHDTDFEYPLTDKSEHVFLFARDSKNNWSAPQPVLVAH